MAHQGTQMARIAPVVEETPDIAVTVDESEIATVAYQLWVEDGCPAGSDKTYWFRAEAMLKSERGAPSLPRHDTQGEMRWVGHWEVWEMEWLDNRWVWDD
jgi:hypothetical protein